MSSLPNPQCAKQGNTIHQSYELPHRAHTAKVYPIKAPNGSSLVIYGHARGLTFLWRGGKLMKYSARTEARDRSSTVNFNGDASSDVAMADTEPLPSSGMEDATSYGMEDDEFDPSRPYERMIHSVELQLHAEVFHLGIPPLHPNASSRPSAFIPTIFSQKAVVAITCADCTGYIITIPLSPSHASSQSAETVTIDPRILQNTCARGIALSWTSRRPLDSMNNTDDEDCDLIVAIHSAIGPGMLSVLKVECDVVAHTTILRQPEEQTSPALEIRHLSSPACSISFNPCTFPSPRHTQLLLVESKGVVRIYDHDPPRPRRRSISVGTASENELRQFASRGSWLTSFYPPFEDSNSGLRLPMRKKILDAQWACNGKCIIVLFGDGEWGLWDVEGVDSQLRGDLPSRIGVNGAAITNFALRGFVGDGTASLKAKMQPTNRISGKQAEKLAPMTPNTRKSKQTNLFSGPKREAATSGFSVGGISVIPIDDLNSPETEETVLVWYADKVYRIPKLMKYWKRAVSASDKGTIGSIEAPSIPAIESVAIGGEKITAIAQFSTPQRVKSTPQSSLRLSEPDVLISAEHLLLIISSELMDPNSTRHGDQFAQESTTNPDFAEIDQDLLSRGDLDLGGVDRMLNGLSSARDVPRLSSGLVSGPGRRVGFATDY